MALQRLRDKLLQGHKRIMLTLPTGGGKTIIAASMIGGARERGLKSMFIADRIDLVDQTSQRLWEYGIPHGVTMSDASFNRNELVQVCSAQTLEKMSTWPAADFYVPDEAHTLRKKVTEHIVGRDAVAIALSATPLTPGLADIYTAIVCGESTDALVSQGWLVPLKVFIGTEVDQSGQETGKEFTNDEASARSRVIVGDAVSEWIYLTNRVFGGKVKTLVYSSSVADGRVLCRQYNEAGYNFELVTHKDTRPQRKDKLKRFHNGALDGLISVEALVKGTTRRMCCAYKTCASTRRISSAICKSWGAG